MMMHGLVNPKLYQSDISVGVCLKNKCDL